MNARHGLRAAVLVALGILGIAPAARAQTHMSPGLWEQQVTVKTPNAQADAAMVQMQQKLADMPADQRKMVEQMMGKSGGVMGAKPSSLRVCITKEQAERDSVPQRDGRCSQQDVTRSGNTRKYKFTCQGQGADAQTVSGSGEFTMNSPTSYTGRSVTDTVVQGQPAHMQTDIAGKWLGSDCGALKPVQDPSR